MRKMIKIEIKNRFTGSIIFEYTKENNTIEETLKEALKSCADLSCADLRDADLRDADLRGANLSCADLSGADLYGAKNKELAYLPIYCKWSHSIIGDKIKIGCKTKSIEEWEEFFNSDAEFETKRDTQEFKQIQAVYEAYKVYLTFLTI
jgi:uncharacterized protein YjbI with pentapeptide repeats